MVRLDPLFNSTDVVSDADLNTLLNEGALDMAYRGAALILSATFNTVASTQRYVLSGASPKVSNFLEIFWDAGGVIYTNASGKVKTHPNDWQFVSEAWLDLHVPGWQDASASDVLQYAFISYDASGYLSLGVHPKSSTTTPSFKIYYLSRGTDMSADANYPWTNSTTNLVHLDPFQKGISFYALWRLHELKTKMQAEADRYMEKYLATALEMRQFQMKVMSAEIQGLTMAGMTQPGETFGSN